jgi:NAD-dependent SIR2 family protein deacetylase
VRSSCRAALSAADNSAGKPAVRFVVAQAPGLIPPREVQTYQPTPQSAPLLCGDPGAGPRTGGLEGCATVNKAGSWKKCGDIVHQETDSVLSWRTSAQCVELMDVLSRFVQQYPRLFVLSGAGVSTGSGIPDYRDEQGRWKRKPPVTLQDFMRSASVRQRYWARSMIGWPVIANARPNAGHEALARLEAVGRVHRLVTQNVDGLHQQAGSARVIELHGNIARVACVDCHAEVSRLSVQHMLEAAHPELLSASALTAPDGDADIDLGDLEAFKVPNCSQCGGILKPDLVFFGDCVPKKRVDTAMEALAQADAMLVIGSSLMIYSGYRFCEHAHRMGKPIAAINLGHTRADHLFRVKIERSCADALVDLVRTLSSAVHPT